MRRTTERITMKQRVVCVLLLGLFAFFSIPSEAQHRRVNFETKPWKQCLKKARKQNRLIFLDCYTEWCGFCKALDQYIFTMDTVADFFNGRFVNVQMDMEKGLGPELCKQYGVKAFPTLLFIDGNGNLVDSWQGYAAPNELFAIGTRANDAEHSLHALTQAYEAGRRDPEFLEEYIAALKHSTWSGRCAEIMKADLSSMCDEEFYTPAVWSLLKKNTDIAFRLLKERVVENRSRFDKLVGAQEVDSILDKAFMGYTSSALNQASRGKMDAESVGQVKEFLLNHRLPYAGEYLAVLYVAEKLNQADYAAVIYEVKAVLRYNFMRLSTLDEFVNFSLRPLAYIEDKQVRREAAEVVRSVPANFIRPRKQALYDCTYEMLLKEK